MKSNQRKKKSKTIKKLSDMQIDQEKTIQELNKARSDIQEGKQRYEKINAEIIGYFDNLKTKKEDYEDENKKLRANIEEYKKQQAGLPNDIKIALEINKIY